jgi:hypothetical protein
MVLNFIRSYFNNETAGPDEIRTGRSFCLDEKRFAYSLAALAASMIFWAIWAGTSS